MLHVTVKKKPKWMRSNGAACCAWLELRVKTPPEQVGTRLASRRIGTRTMINRSEGLFTLDHIILCNMLFLQPKTIKTIVQPQI